MSEEMEIDVTTRWLKKKAEVQAGLDATPSASGGH